ncbi:glycosyltransferase family 2 protein [Microcoleus sp. FACHB-68]|uniref:glycosyltransferase family 2 protein n=1 Tax=Microcoleus sp. FACHB-68 TaxID=2692826 RepID=UPI001683F232|nr:glycosyltransferase family 2 protein [Microcoleus sp. FACHB-68]MBD1936052.1 glycosyltransferase family 2 protein [Microcoleus sp. FACHB-68]
MKHTTIAVLITCFNRKQKTLASLEALFNQVLPPEVSISVYLVDDASTDGTAEAVRQAYPAVKILHGDGNLFWNGGMRMAFEEAIKEDYDYYLWLNDDTLLEPEAVNVLLTTSHRLASEGDTAAVIAISTRDPETGKFTYGGMLQSRWWHPLNLDPLPPSQEAQPCDTICGNCVLIPRQVVERVGNLDPAFVHYAGDWDYGLRAKQQGCTVWIAPGYLGTCSQNPKPAQRTEAQLRQELNKVGQPKGLALQDVILQPMEEWKVLTQRHCGLLWPVYWLLPYRRVLWISLLGRLKGQK